MRVSGQTGPVTCWLILGVAIVTEVTGTLALRGAQDRLVALRRDRRRLRRRRSSLLVRLLQGGTGPRCRLRHLERARGRAHRRALECDLFDEAFTVAHGARPAPDRRRRRARSRPARTRASPSPRSPADGVGLPGRRDRSPRCSRRLALQVAAAGRPPRGTPSWSPGTSCRSSCSPSRSARASGIGVAYGIWTAVGVALHRGPQPRPLRRTPHPHHGARPRSSSSPASSSSSSVSTDADPSLLMSSNDGSA